MQTQAPDCRVTATAHPAVSVIVTGYGVAHLLGEALSSLQSQTLSNWECIVIDDGAPDDVAGAVAPSFAIRASASSPPPITAYRPPATGRFAKRGRR